MSQIENILQSGRKIVVKIGSNVLSDEGGNADPATIENIAGQVHGLIGEGKQVIIVSSGAGVCGVGATGQWARREDINYKQALCAIGQVELMMAYKECFAAYGIQVGQMLLTRGDFTEEQRTLHIRNTLFTLVDEGILPIINENDSVSVDEMKIGDNDTLSALTAILWGADVLICLTDIDGVYDRDPKADPSAQLIENIEDIDDIAGRIHMGTAGDFGTGGIETKIEAAKRVAEYGIPTILLNGKVKDIIRLGREGRARGTCFVTKTGDGAKEGEKP